jgi:leucyl/phenylalanyl-tRNA--protein transferase
MIVAYQRLHLLKQAISIEVWQEEKLVGGLYGVTIGKNVFGESMFSLAPSASKLALIALAQIVGKAGGIIDCQFETPHLLSMGGKHISYDEYMKIINNTD